MATIRKMKLMVPCPVRGGYPHTPPIHLAHCKACQFHEGMNISKRTIKCGMPHDMVMRRLRGEKKR